MVYLLNTVYSCAVLLLLQVYCIASTAIPASIVANPGLAFLQGRQFGGLSGLGVNPTSSLGDLTNALATQTTANALTTHPLQTGAIGLGGA